jgi:hypothetical protein
MPFTPTHTVTLYRHVHNVRVYMEDGCWVSNRQIHLALWHSKRDATNVQPLDIPADRV